MDFDTRYCDDQAAADKATAFSVNCALFSELAARAPWTRDLDVVPAVVACEVVGCEEPCIDRAFTLAHALGASIPRPLFDVIFQAAAEGDPLLRSMAADVIETGSVTSSDTRPQWARSLATDPSAVLIAAIAHDAVAYASGSVEHEWTSSVSALVADIMPVRMPVPEIVPVAAPPSPFRSL